MHVAQFLDPPLRRPNIEIVKAGLPEGAANVFSEQLALPRITAFSPGQQCAGRTLLQHLHYGRRASHLGLGHQQVYMFRHHYVSDHHKAVPLTRLLKNRKEAVASLRRIQQRQSLVTRTGDKVQVVRAVGAMQARGHNNPMISAASYPPLQKAQGRGTHSFETGRKKADAEAGPPAF